LPKSLEPNAWWILSKNLQVFIVFILCISLPVLYDVSLTSLCLIFLTVFFICMCCTCFCLSLKVFLKKDLCASLSSSYEFLESGLFFSFYHLALGSETDFIIFLKVNQMNLTLYNRNELSDNLSNAGFLFHGNRKGKD
jgi:hypothetical protein